MIHREYCGFQYGYDKTEGYSIVPPSNDVPPASFYKYYALNECNVDALTNLYIYASHPNQFNDPFDCNSKLIEFRTWEDVRNWCGEKYDLVKETFINLDSSCDFCQESFRTLIYRKLGLVSLTTRYDNYQMWAMYAQNNGFCVEFDVSQFPFPKFGPFPINYVSSIPYPIRVGEFGGNLSMLVQSNIKNDWWKYEKEWRLYIPSPEGLDMKSFGNEYQMSLYNFGEEHDRKFRYPISAIKRIILGFNFFERLSCNSISPEEIDVVCMPEKNQLELRLLDFLARTNCRINYSVMLAQLNDFNSYQFNPVTILKYADYKFRIIER